MEGVAHIVSPRRAVVIPAKLQVQFESRLGQQVVEAQGSPRIAIVLSPGRTDSAEEDVDEWGSGDMKKGIGGLVVPLGKHDPVEGDGEVVPCPRDGQTGEKVVVVRIVVIEVLRFRQVPPPCAHLEVACVPAVPRKAEGRLGQADVQMGIARGVVRMDQGADNCRSQPDVLASEPDRERPVREPDLAVAPIPEEKRVIAEALGRVDPAGAVIAIHRSRPGKARIRLGIGEGKVLGEGELRLERERHMARCIAHASREAGIEALALPKPPVVDAEGSAGVVGAVPTDVIQLPATFVCRVPGVLKCLEADEGASRLPLQYRKLHGHTLHVGKSEWCPETRCQGKNEKSSDKNPCAMHACSLQGNGCIIPRFSEKRKERGSAPTAGVVPAGSGWSVSRRRSSACRFSGWEQTAASPPA